MADEHNAHVGQTKPSEFDREINWRWIFVFMLLITVVAAGAFGSMWYLGIGFRDQMAKTDRPAPLVAESRDALLPPEPRLQTRSYDDWADMKAAHEEHLASYAWTDRGEGVVRIPIEEAMRRVAEDGLPEFPAPPSTEAPAESGAPGPGEENR